MSQDNVEQLKSIIEPIIDEAVLELFDLTIKFHRGTANIDLIIDRPDGGILIDQCADVNRKVNEAIEASGLYGDDYTVSVASPGLDWPLKTARDFQRLIGQEINVKYSNANATEDVKGTLQRIADDHIVIKTLEGEVEILLENIDKAVLLI